MGGRGAASGRAYGNKGCLGRFAYGDEFRTVLQVDNVKFVEYRLADEAKIPLETQSANKGRIYVVLKRGNVLKSIATYDENGVIDRHIDLDHDHGQGIPHLHRWDGFQRKPAKIEKSDLRLCERVKKIWAQR